MKVPTARFGEHRMFEQLGMPIEGLGDGFSWKSQDHERSAQIAREGWERARTAILSGDHFLVVLDEITYPLIYGWLPLEPVLQALADRPRHVHVMLTGRRCPEEIIAVAETELEADIPVALRQVYFAISGAAPLHKWPRRKPAWRQHFARMLWTTCR